MWLTSGPVPSLVWLVQIIAIHYVIFHERKSPLQTISWVLTLLFLPVLGLMLYILIGPGGGFVRDKRFQKKRRVDEAYDRVIKQQLALFQDQDFQDSCTEQNKDLVYMNLKRGNSIYTDDNAVTVFTSAREKYDRLFSDIAAATDSVHLMYFIFKDDHIGNQLVDVLTQKAAEGVSVRVVYDSMGVLLHAWGVKRMFRRLLAAGGEVRRFLPSPFMNLLRINYRNHRKLAIIDGKIGYTGGINIGDEYLGAHKRITPWRDTHLRVCGSCVADMQLRFLKDWWYLSDEPADEETAARYFQCEPAGQVGMQVVSSGPDSPEEPIKYGYLKMINAAKTTLFIQTPYLIPDQSVSEALKLAAASGVDVRIMIPRIPDKRTVFLATLSYAEELMASGVALYQYDGFLHAKMVVSDETMASIGTTNLDHRSFALDFEINCFLYDQGVAAQCNRIFRADLQHATRMDAATFAKRSRVQRMLESILRILSPLF